MLVERETLINISGGDRIEGTARKSLFVVVFATSFPFSDEGRLSRSVRLLGGSKDHHLTFRSKSRSQIRYCRPGCRMELSSLKISKGIERILSPLLPGIEDCLGSVMNFFSSRFGGFLPLPGQTTTAPVSSSMSSSNPSSKAYRISKTDSLTRRVRSR